MSKFFPFRSSGSIGEPSNHSSARRTNSDRLPMEKSLKSDIQAKSRNRSLSPANSNFDKENNRGYAERPLRRSLSVSSSNVYYDHIENDFCRSPLTARNILHSFPDCGKQRHSCMSDGLLKRASGEMAVASKHVGERDRPASSNCSQYSSGSSKCSSSAPLRCQAPPLTHGSNRFLDRYIDGEQEVQSRRLESESPRNSPVCKRNNGSLEETRQVANLKRPPRSQSKEAIFSKSRKEQYMSRKEVEDKPISTSPERESRYSRVSSPNKFGKSVVAKVNDACAPLSNLKSFDVDYETSSACEDIFEDHSNYFPDLSNSSFKPDWNRNTLNKRLQLKKEEQADAELEKTTKEAEDLAFRLAEAQDGQMTHRDISAEVNNLALKLSNQVKIRRAERTAGREANRVLEMKLYSKIRMLEKEKKENQSYLEMELERRANEESIKLARYQNEEQRLRERVQELAEQNVSIQREISLYKTRDVEDKANLKELETQVNNGSSRMEDMQVDISKLESTVVELQERAKLAESDCGCLKRSYEEKDAEVKGLQKTLCNLQRVNSEQEKTISGLRKDLHDDLRGQSSDTSDGLDRLLKEVLRLGAIEQKLKNEMESYKLEVESLRNENISLLNRLNGGRISLFRLDHELQSRVECFLNQSFLLHDNSSQLCGDLLEFVKACKIHVDTGKAQEMKSRFDDYSLIEFDMKLQNLKRGMGDIKKGWETVSGILQEKNNQDKSDRLSEANKEETVLKEELQAELLLSRTLREKLLSRENELNQLQSDLAGSIWGIDILRGELQKTQDSVVYLTHKLKAADLQMMKKNDSINHLESSLLNCQKELGFTKGMLTKVSEERNELWEEVKKLNEQIMHLNYEMGVLKKKLDSLEEEVLLKEGQISILKDSIKKQPFDILYE